MTNKVCVGQLFLYARNTSKHRILQILQKKNSRREGTRKKSVIISSDIFFWSFFLFFSFLSRLTQSRELNILTRTKKIQDFFVVVRMVCNKF